MDRATARADVGGINLGIALKPRPWGRTQWTKIPSSSVLGGITGLRMGTEKVPGNLRTTIAGTII